MKKISFKFIFTFLALFTCYSVTSQIVYVNHGSTAANPDGSSWANAFQDLQSALSAASSGDAIWVATGTYYPHATDQSVSFDLPSNVALYGGFAGDPTVETPTYDLSLRDFSLNTTILSGDINGDGAITGNSYHVLTAVNKTGQLLVDGFDVFQGFANGATTIEQRGAGLYATDIVAPSKLTIENCQFLENSSVDHGGGFFFNDVNAAILDSRFSFGDSGERGSAFYFENSSSTTMIENCEISDNDGIRGASMEMWNTVHVKNCVIQRNEMGFVLRPPSKNSIVENSIIRDNQGWTGSAVVLYQSNNSIISNCHFIDNVGDRSAVFVRNCTNTNFINCSFKGNVNDNTDSNNPQSSSIGFHPTSSTVNIRNSIFWDNTTNTGVEIENKTGLTVRNCIVQDGFIGDGLNIFDEDPKWVDSELNLAIGSYAINAGDNSYYDLNVLSNADINGNNRILKTTIDLGAQESPYDPDAFVFTMETNQNMEITIPTNNLNSYNVDWGDGSTDLLISGTYSHSYSSHGTYTVQVTGDPKYIQFGALSTNERNNLKTVEQWGNIQWESMKSMFYQCQELEYKALDSPDLMHLDNNASLQNMFYGASKVSNHDEVWDWDVSQVKNMASMFRGATNFNANISGWIMTNVERIDGMFNSASSFNQPVGNWTITDKITSLRHTFSGASSFNFSIANWDTKNVTDMSGTFHQALVFNQSLNSWNVSNVTKMNQMFLYAFNFNNGESISNPGPKPLLKADWDVSQVTTMVQMFRHTAFNQDISDWDVGNVETFSQMFLSNQNFNQNLNNWVVTKSTNFRGMFQNADSFDQKLDNWVINTTDPVNMNAMFYSTNSFNRNIGDWNISKVFDMKNILYFSNLNECNYDATLNGWTTQNGTPTGLILGANGVKYDDDQYKVDLTSNYGWIITDAGQGSCGGTPRKKSPTSIEDAESENLQFYPNPTSNSIQLNGFEEDVQVILMDVRGKVVLKINVINNTQIDVSSLAKGVYVIQAIDNFNHSIYDKLIIK